MKTVEQALIALGEDRNRIERKVRHSTTTKLVRAFLASADIERIEHTHIREPVFHALLDVVMILEESDDAKPLIADAMQKLEHLFGRPLDSADVEEMARLANAEGLSLWEIHGRFRSRSVPLM